MPLISIITPVHNGAAFLPGLVACLKAQTYPHWECLLIDHASTDDSFELSQRLVADDLRFRCLTLAGPLVSSASGPAAPRNLGLDEIRGAYVCFLDVDDVWHPRKLELQLAFHCQQQLQLSVTAYGRTHLSDPTRFTRRCPPSALSRRRLAINNCVPILTVMFNAELIGPSIAYQPLRFVGRGHEDYLFWLQLWCRFPDLRYGCLPTVLALHQRHGANFSARRWRVPIWLFRVYRRVGLSVLPALVLAARCSTYQLLQSLVERLGWGGRSLPESDWR